jgi:hypothetical protein
VNDWAEVPMPAFLVRVGDFLLPEPDAEDVERVRSHPNHRTTTGELVIGLERRDGSRHVIGAERDELLTVLVPEHHVDAVELLGTPLDEGGCGAVVIDRT